VTDPAVPDRPLLVEDLERPGMTLVASATATNGAFELVEDIRDRGMGPVPHIHDDRDEAFYVLDGAFTFTRGHDEIEAGPGTFVFVPRGTRHAYRSTEDGSRTLFIVVPPGLSGFLREQGRLMAAGASPREAMEAVVSVYDTHPVD
jgi:mannose-6-phosphate isomerase-like protein (cupin superfamily)